MALKATIFKVGLQIADMDRNYYADHALTIARCNCSVRLGTGGHG